MNEIVNHQTLLFLKSIQIGVVLAIAYDLIRIFRKLIKHPDWIVQMEDILYWGVCILLGFSMLYMHNYGEIRLYIFLGIILGAIFYLLTLSIVFMRVATYIIDVLKQLITYMIRLIGIPIKWLLRLMKIPLNFLVNKFAKMKKYGKNQHKQIKKRYYYNQADRKTEYYIRKSVKNTNDK